MKFCNLKVFKSKIKSKIDAEVEGKIKNNERQ